MANIPGTNVASTIAPFTTDDQFPTHDAIYGKGGQREVATIAERDAIPSARLTEGCTCYVAATEKTYRWKSNTWVDDTPEIVSDASDISYTPSGSSTPTNVAGALDSLNESVSGLESSVEDNADDIADLQEGAVAVDVNTTTKVFAIKNAKGQDVGTITVSETTGLPATLTLEKAGTNGQSITVSLPTLAYNSQTQMLEYVDATGNHVPTIKLSNLQIKYVGSTDPSTGDWALGDLILVGSNSSYELKVYDGNGTWQPLGSINDVSLVADQVSYDNTDSGLQATFVQDAIDELNSDLGLLIVKSDSETTFTFPSYGNMQDGGWGINGNTSKWTAQSERRLYFLSYTYKHGDKLQITGHSPNSSYIAFLTEKPSSYTEGGDIPYATYQRTGAWEMVNSGVTKTFDIPSDCKYILFNAYYGAGSCYLPSNPKILHHNVEVKTEINVAALGAMCAKEEVEETKSLKAQQGQWQPSGGEPSETATIRAHLLIECKGCDSMTLTIPSGWYANIYVVDDNYAALDNGSGWQSGTYTIELDVLHNVMLNVKYGNNDATIYQSMCDAAPFGVILHTPAGYLPAAPYEQVAELLENAQGMPLGYILSNCVHESQGESEEVYDMSKVTFIQNSNTYPTQPQYQAKNRLIFSKETQIPTVGISNIEYTIAGDAISNSHIKNVACQFFDENKTLINTPTDFDGRFADEVTIGQAINRSIDITGSEFANARYFVLYFLTGQNDSTEIYTTDVNLDKITITLTKAKKTYTKAVDEVMFDELVSQLGLRSTGSYEGAKISINHKYDIEEFCTMTVAPNGKSSQGAAVWGNYLFHFCASLATIFVYDLTTKAVVKTFTLTGNDDNHANSGAFGMFYDDSDPFPLLYVAAGTINDRNIYVYRITGGSVNDWSIALHQTITLPTQSTSFLYLPNVAIDRDNGKMVVYGYKDGTAWADASNRCVVAYIDIPSMSGDVEIIVNLDEENYRNDFEKISIIPHILATQGASARYGTLYMAYGNSGSPYNNGGFLVIDYVNGIVRSKCDFYGVKDIEPEALCLYGEGALIPTQFPSIGHDGKMYYIKF